MNKKHFIKIADALRKANIDPQSEIINTLCSVFKSINPNFSKTMFVDAIAGGIWFDSAGRKQLSLTVCR